jgi:hypothetical protein
VRLPLPQIGFRAYNWRGLRTPPSNLDQASISPHTNSRPVYDEAYLNELKASTPSSRPRIPEGGTHDDGTPITSAMEDSAMESLDTIGNRLHIPFFRTSMYRSAFPLQILELRLYLLNQPFWLLKRSASVCVPLALLVPIPTNTFPYH